jgi:YegS/Rv2252/BmrU family lipid kinase
MKPEDGYIFYIINPKAGASGLKTTSRKFVSYLSSKGFKVQILTTSCLRDGFEFSRSAAESRDCAMVVVVGGDGVIREVADGLKGSGKPLLIIPGGTENLLANELGFDEKFETIIKTFEDGFTRPMDLGSVNGKSFTSVAGFGFDGDIVKRVSGQRSGHIDYLDYVWPIWRTFWDYKFRPMKVEVDGETIYQGRALVFVGNISRYAIGLEILHYADFGDGLLDVCVYKCSNRPHLVKHSILTIMKKHSGRGDVIYRQGKQIRISSRSSDIATEIDGDPGPALPVEIKVIPQAITLLVPKGAKPAGIRTRLIRALG